MGLTIFLAKILGVYLLLGGLSVLLYPKRYDEAMKEAKKSYLLPYFDGALALIFGLLIVLTHNMWGTFVEGVVTAVGWLAVIEGVAMFLLPHESFVAFMNKFSGSSARMGFGVLALVLGIYLISVGFFV